MREHWCSSQTACSARSRTEPRIKRGVFSLQKRILQTQDPFLFSFQLSIRNG